MISLNSLSAFAQEISRRPGADAVGQATRVAGAGRSASAGGASGNDAAPQQRILESAPSGPAPARPMPRGSLLDLRV